MVPEEELDQTDAEVIVSTYTAQAVEDLAKANAEAIKKIQENSKQLLNAFVYLEQTLREAAETMIEFMNSFEQAFPDHPAVLKYQEHIANNNDGDNTNG